MTHKLIVRGTEGQIAQVKQFLATWKGTDDKTGPGQRYILLPIGPGVAKLVMGSTVTNFKELRPSNPVIEQKSPSVNIDFRYPSGPPEAKEASEKGAAASLPKDQQEAIKLLKDMLDQAEEAKAGKGAKPPATGSSKAPAVPKSPPAVDAGKAKPQPDVPKATKPAKPPAEATPPGGRVTDLPPQGLAGPRIVMVAEATKDAAATAPAKPASPPAATAAKPSTPAPAGKAGKAPAAPAPAGDDDDTPPVPATKPATTNAPVEVTIGPNGVMIVSDDPDALADFKDLLENMASLTSSKQSGVTVFWLKHAKAMSAAQTLDDIYGGGTLPDSLSAGGGGGGGLFGALANAALGDATGGLFPSLLGMGGDDAAKPSGDVHIVPDVRLNALIVQANAADTDMMEQLLKIIDTPKPPEDVLANPKPRLIPILNLQASDVANMVRQLYADRLTTANGAGAMGGRGGAAGGGGAMNMLTQLAGGGRGGRGGATRRRPGPRRTGQDDPRR